MNRKQVETIINNRCGSLLQQAGMLITPISSSDCLSDPIAWGLSVVGVTAVDILQPSDADLASVPAASNYKLIDYIELKALENAAQRYTGVDTSSQGESRSDNQIRQALVGAVERKRSLISMSYGVLAPPLVQGRVPLFFQESYPEQE
jgi:hypothetical protein